MQCIIAYSTKSVSESGRNMQTIRIHDLNQAKQFPPQKTTLIVTDNKHQLIRIIIEELGQYQEFRKKHPSNHELLLTIETVLPVECYKGMVIQRAEMKVRKTARIRNRYNQVQHLSQDTTWESNKITINITNKSQEASP